MRILSHIAIVVLTLTAPGGARTCESLASLRVPGMTVTSERRMPFPKLPPFCRVAATLRPTSDSEIHI
ncbi:MAG TPA: hypothetical protein VK493_04875, partial [Bryobacteraceae bacterium]|nr:hypothetical protein [Bryobacteraceae bacterium]